MAIHSIRKATTGFGFINEFTLPWPAMILKHRIEYLKKVINDIKEIQDIDSDLYKNTVKHFYEHLRETWERFIEEVLLDEVVQRFQLSIQTKRLGSVVVSDEDYKAVYFNMAKVSGYCHDEAQPFQRPLPKPNELEEDLDIL